MPSVVAESDLFPATLQRPNNGELADSASILLYLQGVANRQRWTYNRMRTRVFDVTQKYGAVAGTGDSTAAIQAAIDDAALLINGGEVFLPGEFRHTGLTLYSGVSLVGIPGVSRLNLNHATNSAITWSGNSRKIATQITGLSFLSVIDNTGHVLNVPSSNAAWVNLSNCAINDDLSGGAFKGRLVFCQGADSRVTASDSYIRAVGDASADAFFMGGANGILQLDRNQLVMPVTYSSKLIEIDDGRLLATGNDFDITANTSGTTPSVIDLLTTGYHVLKGNVFRGAFSSAACVTAFGGTKLSETDSVFDTVNGYNITGGPLAQGSDLTLQNPIGTTSSASGTLTCATGYRAQSFHLSNAFGGNGPSITLPDRLFIGQEFTLTVYNASGTNWTLGIGISGGIVGGSGSVNTGKARVMHFKVLDVEATNSPRWIQMADASSAWTV